MTVFFDDDNDGDRLFNTTDTKKQKLMNFLYSTANDLLVFNSALIILCAQLVGTKGV